MGTAVLAAMSAMRRDRICGDVAARASLPESVMAS